MNSSNTTPVSVVEPEPAVSEDPDGNAANRCITDNRQSTIRSQNESILAFPDDFLENLDDVRNENPLTLTRLVDTSMWEQFPEPQQEPQELVVGHTEKVKNLLLSLSLSPNNSPSDSDSESDSESTSITSTSTIEDLTQHHNSNSRNTTYGSNLSPNNNEGSSSSSTSSSNNGSYGRLTEETHAWNSNDTDTCLNLNSNTDTETEVNNTMLEAEENPTSEPICIHVIAEWPSTNTDFGLLTKMDDEYSSLASEPFYTNHRVSDVFNPEDWFVRPELTDDDIPIGRRLRPNPGQVCLTPVESWTSCESTDSNISIPLIQEEEPSTTQT